MTIRKGEEWGSVGVVPLGAVLVHDNGGLCHLLNLEPADRPEVVLLGGGDLARTLGAPATTGQIEAGMPAVIADVDLAVAHHDGGVHRFAAHAIARSRWWRGSVVGVFNAQFRGAWDVVPRAHPSDGRLDIIEVAPAMRTRERWAARRRLRTATHVPHPHIALAQATAREWTFTSAQRLFLDDVAFGSTTRLRIEVEPNALTVCVPLPPGRGDVAPGRRG